MRTPTLQYFYLQKPMFSLIVICIISSACWIGCGDFYTKGEPREASVAISMLNDNEWILPHTYADEIAYKPPFTHWLIAAFSAPQGKVTPFTSRLPSAIAFVGLICISFIFFGQRLKTRQAFLTSILLLTSFELHRAAMTSRVDMMLTFLTVLGLFLLFRWEDKKKLKGFPLSIPIVLGLAALVKGPVGIVLPLLVFGIYLLFLKHNLLKIIQKLLPVVFASLILPAIWYLLAYKEGGQAFLDLIYAENFGRFLGSDNLNIHYELGHEEPFWYNFITLISGFIPWTILLLLSVFGLKSIRAGRCKQPETSNKTASTTRQKIIGLLHFNPKNEENNATSKINLFSLISAVVIVLFYCIPLSKRSVYLMPAYPFISVFIAQYILYLTKYSPKTGKIFGYIIGGIACLLTGIGILVAFHWFDPEAIAGLFTNHQKTINDAAAIRQNLSVNFLYFVLFFALVGMLLILFKQLRKKNHIKILYATIAVYFAIFLFADGIFLPAFKNGVSNKSYAEYLQESYSIDKNNVFVLNNLLEYSNMYGLNFYLNNCFHNFETEQPDKGYFLVGANSFDKVLQKYGLQYQFRLLEKYENPNRDGEKVILFYFFEKN